MFDAKNLGFLVGNKNRRVFYYASPDSLYEVEKPDYFAKAGENLLYPGNILVVLDTTSGNMMARWVVAVNDKTKEVILGPVHTGPLPPETPVE